MDLFLQCSVPSDNIIELVTFGRQLGDLMLQLFDMLPCSLTDSSLGLPIVCTFSLQLLRGESGYFTSPNTRLAFLGRSSFLVRVHTIPGLVQSVLTFDFFQKMRLLRLADMDERISTKKWDCVNHGLISFTQHVVAMAGRIWAGMGRTSLAMPPRTGG